MSYDDTELTLEEKLEDLENSFLLLDTLVYDLITDITERLDALELHLGIGEKGE